MVFVMRSFAFFIFHFCKYVYITENNNFKKKQTFPKKGMVVFNKIKPAAGLKCCKWGSGLPIHIKNAVNINKYAILTNIGNE